MKWKTNNTNPDHDKSGIYKLTCNTCHKAYIGQKKRSWKLRYQAHTRYIKNNNPQSAYAMHILNNRHEYGPIHNTMELLKNRSTKLNSSFHMNSYTFSPTTITNNWSPNNIAENAIRCTNWSSRIPPSHQT
jgi:hypothetical protein